MPDTCGKAEIINLAVVGCGRWGPNLVRSFSEIETSRVGMACDLREDRLKDIKIKYPNVSVTQKYSDVLDEPRINAVVIATPASSHYELAIRALRCGKHVLVEKPIACSSDMARKMIGLAEEKGCILMVDHIFEYNPAVVKVKELIEDRMLGDIYYIDSVRGNLNLHHFDLGVTWDLGSHDLSIILYWLDTEPLRVHAFGRSYIRKEFEDVVFITLEFPNRIMAHIHLSWIVPCKLRRTTVIGDKKMIVYDDLESTEKKVKIYEKAIGAMTTKNSKPFVDVQRNYHSVDVVSPHFQAMEPLKAACLHFLKCIKEGTAPRTDGYSGLRVVRILEAVDRSLKKGGQVQEL